MTGKANPWYCPSCYEVPEGYYGRLVFPEELPHPADYWEAIAAGGGVATPDPEPPTCPSPAHKKEDGTFETVLLVPVASRQILDRYRVVPVQKEISANA